MLFLPTFPSIKRQRIGSISFSNTHHILLLLPNLTIWWGNTKMVYVPTTYQISPSSCHFYASSYYLWTIGNSSTKEFSRSTAVVICFHFSIFEPLETAHIFLEIALLQLWFAFILVSLNHWKQHATRGCRKLLVVICFHFSIFEPLETAFGDDGLKRLGCDLLSF